MTAADVGVIHAYRSRPDVCRYLLIGWTMHPDFHGHGSMTDAARALLAREWPSPVSRG